jgi:predicted MFS family arabinose efflux permease
MMKRSVINPVLVLCGGFVLLSGFFLMFHWESHFAKVIHQVCGVLLVIFGVMHVVLNWKALKISLKDRLSMRVVVLLFVICVVVLALTGKHQPH